MTVTLYHNPACGTSRNTLAMIRASGVEPTIVPYIDTGWSRDTLLSLAARIGVPLKALLREKGSPAAELNLLRDDVSDDELLAAMIAHPILVNRPIVDTPRGTRLCRPLERVFDLLDTPPVSFTQGRWRDGSGPPEPVTAHSPARAVSHGHDSLHPPQREVG